jgi:hypothetical protein
MVEFLFGFICYEYRKAIDSAGFKADIAASIDAGRPVIVKVKSGKGLFRVITGYDGDSLINPDYSNAQNKPEGMLEYDVLEALYIIGEKIEPRYTLKDSLERIKKVMGYNISGKLWSGYTEKMGLYTSDSFGGVDIDGKKARMKRVAATMWHTFNCHNFAEVFRHCRDGGTAYDRVSDMKKLREPEFKELCNKIGGECYGYTHDLAWALIGLEERADWTAHYAGYFGEMTELTLSQIEKNDEKALDCINRIIELL